MGKESIYVRGFLRMLAPDDLAYTAINFNVSAFLLPPIFRTPVPFRRKKEKDEGKQTTAPANLHTESNARR